MYIQATLEMKSSGSAKRQQIIEILRANNSKATHEPHLKKGNKAFRWKEGKWDYVEDFVWSLDGTEQWFFRLRYAGDEWFPEAEVLKYNAGRFFEVYAR